MAVIVLTVAFVVVVLCGALLLWSTLVVVAPVLMLVRLCVLCFVVVFANVVVVRCCFLSLSYGALVIP